MNLLKDLRYAARSLRLNPGFATVAILSLALGIGANAAIFQLLDAVRFSTLPVKDPQTLVQARLVDSNGVRGNQQRGVDGVTNPIWEQIRNRQQVFSGIFAWGTETFNISPQGEMIPGRGLWVSGDFFRVLGVPAVRGRVFTAHDDHRGCGLPGAVVSYPFWQREFGGEDSAIGKKVVVNNHPVEVIGVTPESFFGLEVGQNFDIALPICSDAAVRGGSGRLDSGTDWWLVVMGRPQPGMPLERVAASLGAMSTGVFEASLTAGYPPVSVKNFLAIKLTAVSAATGLSPLREQYSDPLVLLLGIAGLVLLIACANLANLMLARASARGREIAVRLAIGASRGQLIRQLMTESLLIAAVGASLGLLLSHTLSRLLVSFLNTQGTAVFVDLRQDWRVLAFTAGLAILTCVLFGLTPALRAARTSPGEVLKSGSRGMTAGRERFGLRRILVSSQIAISLVLLAASLLFVESLRTLMTLETGFQQNGLLVAAVRFSGVNLPPDRLTAFRHEMLDRLRALPGVEGVTETDQVPVGGGQSSNAMWMDGRSRDGADNVYRSFIGSAYFKTLGTPLLAGRELDDRDTATSARAVVVNEAFARKFTGGANPVGQRLWIEATPSTPETICEIVGLVRNTKYFDLHEDFKPIVFSSLNQTPSPLTSTRIMIRSTASLGPLVEAIRSTLRELNPDIRYRFSGFPTIISETLLRDRLMATLSGFFGGLAVLLATIGLYGVIAYMVAQRTNEIGIRMALGAVRGDVLRLIFREAGTLLAGGLVLGTLLALFAARAIESLLFGVHSNDPMTLLAAASALATVALAASYLPARRASRLDPTVALRQE